MLKRFEVQGYKNFKDRFILDFSDVRDYQFNTECIKNNLINHSIIYGKNAVGKTNFGRAILDVRSNFYRAMREPVEDTYLNADSNLDYAEFKYVFQFDDDEVVYEYKKKSECVFKDERLTINGDLIFYRDYNKNKNEINNLKIIGAETLNWQLIDEELSILSYLINNIPVSTDNILTKLYYFIRGMTYFRSEQFMPMGGLYIQELIKKNEVEELEKFLNSFGLNEKLKVKMTPTGEKELYFAHTRPISFWKNLSSGTMSLVRLYRWYKRAETATFLYMDEFDAFYHYELSEDVIKMIKKLQNCQTIATSHNTNLFSNQVMRPDCLFILTKEKMVAVANATDRELREGHNLEKLYKSGEFDV